MTRKSKQGPHFNFYKKMTSYIHYQQSSTFTDVDGQTIQSWQPKVIVLN